MLLGVLLAVVPAAAQPPAGPTARPADCPVPAATSPRASCAHVDVPLRAADPGAGLLAIAVTRIGAAGAPTQPPLVVVGDGMPAVRDQLLADGPLAVLGRDREVVLVDQRGTGASTPSLACPEADVADAGSAPDVDLRSLLRAVEACRARLAAEVVPLDAFTAAAAAADLGPVVQALGLGTVDLVGTGSGAAVVLEALREDPAWVRAAAVDAPTGDDDLVLQTGSRFARVLDELSLACTGGRPCGDGLGALDDELAAGADALAAQPAVVTVAAPDGTPVPAQVTDADLLQLLFDRLSAGRADAVVQLVEAAASRSTPVLDALVTEQRDVRTGSAGNGIGLALTRICAGDAARTDAAALDEAAAGVPEPIRAHWLPTSPLHGHAVFEACAIWDVPADAATPAAPVTTGVPLLVTAGGLDPVGSPDAAALVAGRVATGHLVTFSDQGRQPLLTDGDCAAAVLRRFLEDPAAPDARCAADPSPRAPSPTARVAGDDRIATAIAASRLASPEGAGRGAVLAPADRWFDAIVGAPLASGLRGPLLLTPAGALDDRVGAELQRVVREGGEVLLVGGALADPVAEAVEALGLEPRRVAGPSDAATAVAVAELLADRGRLQRVFLADARTFADPLVASPLAAAARGAVLPTDGDAVPAEVRAFLDRIQRPVIAIGGGATRAEPSAGSIAGPTRYETAAMVAATGYLDPTTFGIASGADFPDAAAAGAVLGLRGSPLLLTPPDAVHPATRAVLGTAPAVTSVLVFGGPGAVADAVVAGYEAAW